jgi:hypothetical protein
VPEYLQPPNLCVAVMTCRRPGERVVAIVQGCTGYFATDLDPGAHASDADLRTLVDNVNGSLGVDPLTKDAMIDAAMHGIDPRAPDGMRTAPAPRATSRRPPSRLH